MRTAGRESRDDDLSLPSDLPLTLDAVEWASKTVRSGGVSGPLHEEWSVRFTLSSLEAPVRAAVYVETAGRRFFDKESLRRSTQRLDLAISLRPWDWAASDAIWIGTGHPTGVHVEDPALKADPRSALTVADSGIALSTGRPIALLHHPASDTTLGIVVVRSSDTRADRTRWRLKEPARGRLHDHTYLNSGRAAGESPAPGGVSQPAG
ncbi:MAG: hypothetical protein LWW77_08090 [Propionibacteriales bacterium]|nr:hypothetical protein [Propionibacteriales bacterium]